MATVIQDETTTQNGSATPSGELVREMYGGELYEYYPLGKYIVRAPGVCGGRPTFKYTRLEPSVILAQLSLGRTVQELVNDYQPSKVSVEGVYEAIKLANRAFMAMHHTTQNGTATPSGELMREMYGGELYEYYPLGKYIVRAPGVCGGRPTFKYTRLEPSIILALLAQDDTVEDVLANYHRSKISAEAIYEAIYLANQAFMTLHHAHINPPEEWKIAKS